jgi:hypothetical protein
VLFRSAKHTFSGYAAAQISRAKGQNRWVSNPQPETIPDKLDFVTVIPLFTQTMFLAQRGEVPSNFDDGFPMRPVPIKELKWDLSKYVVAKLEHHEHTYRLYEVPDARGVFRGQDQQLVVESISKEDEFRCLRGLLHFNEPAYEAAKRDWKNYWTWHKERNASRWVAQEKGEINFDVKNICHCVRLLLSGINILKFGEPIVRFAGEQRQFLMDIRYGKYDYDFLMKYAAERMTELDELYETSILQRESDKTAIDELYLELIGAKQ